MDGIALSASKPVHELANLTIGAEYEVQARFANEVGPGKWSQSSVLFMEKPTGKPESSGVPKYSGTSAVLQWAAPIPMSGIVFIGYTV